MSDKDKIKNASNNMIDLMSKFGKQFLSEAIDQGEPLIDLINNLTKGDPKERKGDSNDSNYSNDSNDNFFTESKNKRIQVNESITFIGPDHIFNDIVETDSSFTLLFILYGVNRQDFILEKNDTSIEVFCKTSISDSRIMGFKYKDREIKFNLKFSFDIQCLNILAELRDGLLKIDIEKPDNDTDDDLITIV